ncbi:MAG: PD-(D/E)XK nuclease family protein [Terracidiphilus sp.]
MDIQSWGEIDAWLRGGGLVVASSDRAARALQAEFHRRRRNEGLTAWPTPDIVDWKSFTRKAWEDRNFDGRLLLNSAQELSVWCEIIHSEHHLPTTLSASVRRLATMAVEACELLSSYAPRFLRAASRIGWDRDSGEFSKWLAEFDERCDRNSFISASHLPLELIPLLQADSASRPPLRLAGFDRLLPVQQQLFDAWGQWQQFQIQGQQAQTHFYRTPDSQTELESCAYCCHTRLAAKPDARILVITQDASQRRGEIERAFLRFFEPNAPLPFEFSLGIPLTTVPLVRSALLLLRWLGEALSENELDWLFASRLAASPEESSALQSSMRRLRHLDQQRLQWPLEGFFNQGPIATALPVPWKRSVITAQRSLKELGASLSPIEWADKVPHLLETIGWPGTESKTSVEFQMHRRWQQALDTAGSLGFDGRHIPWQNFLSELEHAAADILFSPQSSDAPIQIAGPAESAGLTADAVWFLGADEESWPPVASLHPFLPPHVRRESAMPHSSHQLDWQFASAITNRLLSTAPEVHFSFAAQKDDAETRPSRLIAQLPCVPQPLPANQVPPSHEEPVAIPFIDSTSAAFARDRLSGGASVLSFQSQCPFKAFASARLDAKDWDAAEVGLSAKQRGQLLHDVLHSIWSGPPKGIRSHSDLIAVTDLASFVRTHVRSVLKKKVPAAVRGSMPGPYIDLEESRLIRLITEWLEFESARVPFTVAETEAVHTVTIAGLTMNLRFDRVDRLVDDSSLVIDYKTGNVGPKSWDLPRPEDLQLPLYKVFGLEPLQPSLFNNYGGPPSGGLVFARIRPGDTCFAGRVADPQKTIDPNLTGSSSLVRRRLTGLDESTWKEYIDQLARDFIHGRASVDPRDYPKTCERCGLQSVCRIQDPENRAEIEEDEITEENDEG